MFSRYVVSQFKQNYFFLVGVTIGVWVALVAVPLDEPPAATCKDGGPSAAPLGDDYEPLRQERPASEMSGAAAGRSVQRPRYYSTELGMRAPLLAGVLTSSDALSGQAAALNATAARLQPALRFFMTASAPNAPPAANVVGFTDTREMLKPFHALKYLADNYLEEYNFFFLVSDASFVNAQRLSQLVSKLSVSQDIYMGLVTEDDSHYCTLEGGILLSNSVLRAMHSTLDWCVRNSYSPHHHENLGRCVLHASQLACMSALQGSSYTAVKVETEGDDVLLSPALADAVTAFPLTHTKQFYEIHAYVSRLYLERDAREMDEVAQYMMDNSLRHPPHYRNVSWPPGLRNDPGLNAALPETRFEHLRWTLFNATHSFMLRDNDVAAPLSDNYKQALDLVIEAASAWALHRWGAGGEGSDAGGEGNAGEPRGVTQVTLIEGAWCWEPATALRYRLLFRLQTEDANVQWIRQVLVVRPLGAARLLAVPYVTESARVTLVLPLLVSNDSAIIGDQLAAHSDRETKEALQFLDRYEALCLNSDKNTALIVVLSYPSNGSPASASHPIRARLDKLTANHRSASLQLIDTPVILSPSPSQAPHANAERAKRQATISALSLVPRDSLLLLSVPYMDFNEDFLNRVRMNSISGVQWFAPLGFARFAQYALPSFRAPDGSLPTHNTGRFLPAERSVFSAYRRDLDRALAEHASAPGVNDESLADTLARTTLHCARAPEPSLVLAPRAAPCHRPASNQTSNAAEYASCLSELLEDGLSSLNLGARHSLAKLLLETSEPQHEPVIEPAQARA